MKYPRLVAGACGHEPGSQSVARHMDVAKLQAVAARHDVRFPGGAAVVRACVGAGVAADPGNAGVGGADADGLKERGGVGVLFSEDGGLGAQWHSSENDA